MSKMDDLRKMREARYEADRARAATARGTAPAAAPRRPPTAPPAPAAPAASTPAPSADEAPATTALCGHRNMSGRTCTREHGHAAKSHRYS